MEIGQELQIATIMQIIVELASFLPLKKKVSLKFCQSGVEFQCLGGTD